MRKKKSNASSKHSNANEDKQGATRTLKSKVVWCNRASLRETKNMKSADHQICTAHGTDGTDMQTRATRDTDQGTVPR